MSEANESKAVRKRIRRSPEMIAQLVLEAERRGNTAEICRRESIQPTQFYAWKRKFKEGGVSALTSMKRGPKTKDPEKSQLEAENRRLKSAFVEASIELLLLKKSVSSGYMET